MPVAPTTIYDLNGLIPCNMLPRPVKDARRIQPGIVNMPKGIVLAESAVNANAVHTYGANGATAGAFTLTFRGFTTTILPFNATAAAIAAALNALPSIGAGGVVQSGTAFNSTGTIITWSGARFTNQPIELPVLTITTAFATTQPTVVSTTTGSALGTLGPYINADGTFGTPRAFGMFRMSTDADGLVTYGAQAGGEEYGQRHLTASVYYSGAFRIEDLPIAAIVGITGGFLDSGAATTPFLKVAAGSLASGVGIVHLL